MDIYHVFDRVQRIRDNRHDDEQAHAAEDRLYRDVLRDIAANSTDQESRGLATEALRADDIDFARWYA